MRPGRDLRQHLERLVAGIESILNSQPEQLPAATASHQPKPAAPLQTSPPEPKKGARNRPQRETSAHSPSPIEDRPNTASPHFDSLRLGTLLYFAVVVLSVSFLIFTIVTVQSLDSPESPDYHLAKWVSVAYYLSVAAILGVVHWKATRRGATIVAMFASLVMAGWACFISQRIGFGEVYPAWIIATAGLGAFAWMSRRRP